MHCIPQQPLPCEVRSFKSGPGETWSNWKGIDKKDLQRMDVTLEEVEITAFNRQEAVRVCPMRPRVLAESMSRSMSRCSLVNEAAG